MAAEQSTATLTQRAVYPSFAVERSFCCNPKCTSKSQPVEAVCERCKLVQYCSTQCQEDHRSKHNRHCQSTHMSDAWKPRWVDANPDRGPDFPFGVSTETNKPTIELWGDMPAIDILKLEPNEGLNYSEALSMLFAASGDLRNVIETVLSLPETMLSPVAIMVNDEEFAIVRRNILLLATALMFPAKQVGHMMVHLWYSMFLSPDIAVPFGFVCEEMRKVYDQIKGDGPNASHTILDVDEAQSTMETILRPSVFSKIYMPFLDAPAVTFDEVKQQQRAQMVEPKIQDVLDMMKFVRSPPHRLATASFQNRGVLLPFGASIKSFKIPNPTIFNQDCTKDPMQITQDPLAGWDLEKVQHYAPSAPNDLYGALYFYLCDKCERFAEKVKRLPIRFLFTCGAAEDVGGILQAHKLAIQQFDRIDTSNLADYRFLGPLNTLDQLSYLLKPVSRNPHATIIMLTVDCRIPWYHVKDVNIILEAFMDDNGNFDEHEKMARFKHAELNVVSETFDHYGDSMLHSWLHTSDMYWDQEQIFHDYARGTVDAQGNETAPSIEEHAWDLGMEMKEDNTVVEQWPCKLKGSADDEEAKAEFERNVITRLHGRQRYMEFRWVN